MGAEAVEGPGVADDRGLGCREGEGWARKRGAASLLPQVSCQKLNHKKAEGEQQGKKGEKGDGEGGGDKPAPPPQ